MEDGDGGLMEAEEEVMMEVEGEAMNGMEEEEGAEVAVGAEHAEEVVEKVQLAVEEMVAIVLEEDLAME